MRINPVAAACSTLLLATAVSAQQSNLDAVTVTGFRHAIETSIETKRNADSIVESVTAEDIGKLPDVSIAESLARLPGVAGVRGSDGRVQTISIRGLPPQFSNTLLNGREMVSSGDNRSVEYDQFPSELFSSVVVYKTPTASLVGQGLAGTVDLRTVNPLSFGGRQIAVNARGETNSNGEGIAGVASQYGKRFSASYIDQSADKSVGWALGFAHLDTPTQVRQSQMWDWAAPANDWGSGTVVGLPNATNGGLALMPMGMEVTASSKNNKRDGLMGVLEFKPNKDLHSQVDLYYSKFDAADQGFKFETSNWGLWNGPNMPFLTNAKTTDVGLNTFVTSGTMNNSQTVLQSFNSSRTDEIKSLGWNTSYNLDKSWKLTGDVSYSKDTRDEKYLETFSAPYAAGAWTLGSFNFVADPIGKNLIQLSPTGSTSFAASNLRLGDPMTWVGTVKKNGVDVPEDPGFAGNINLPHVTDTMKTLRLSARRTLDGIFSEADFGFNYTQRDKSVEMNRYRLNIANPTTKQGDGRYSSTIPNSAVLGLVNLDFAGLSGMPRLNVQNLVDSGVLVPQNVFWGKAGDDSIVHEKVSTAHAMAKIDTNMGSVPVSGNIGVQFVRTDQSSEGWIYTGNTASPDPAKLIAATGGTTYNDVLPSMNLRFDLPAQTVLRVAAGRQMARPDINAIRAGIGEATVVCKIPAGPTTPAGSCPATGTADTSVWKGGASGNPELQPWRATAYDLSLEKYFGKRSYVAVAEYYKKLHSWIYNQDLFRDYSGAINSSGLPNPVSPFGIATVPANGQGGSVRGLEWTASLDGALVSKSLDGIGVIFNGTLASSNLHDKDGRETVLEGLSGRSTNLTLYYEQHGFSARVSERYRSPFTTTYRNVVFQDVTTRINSDNVVDLQLGYAFDQGSLKGLSLLFQVNNVTDSATQQMQSINVLEGKNPTPDKSQLVTKWVNNFGRQLLFGVNYKF
jgi:TonB-dependent receptor